MSGRWSVTAGAAVLVGALLSGCSGEEQPDAREISVFDLEPGMCFNPPETEIRERATLVRVPCDEPHQQEVYAVVEYRPPAGVESTGYPGEQALEKFADGACADHFADYVGTDYPDSTLFFSHLIPSARGWEQEPDRDVTCFVLTTGEPLTGSVAGSGL